MLSSLFTPALAFEIASAPPLITNENVFRRNPIENC